jgi:hypothetical protein
MFAVNTLRLAHKISPPLQRSSCSSQRIHYSRPSSIQQRAEQNVPTITHRNKQLRNETCKAKGSSQGYNRQFFQTSLWITKQSEVPCVSRGRTQISALSYFSAWRHNNTPKRQYLFTSRPTRHPHTSRLESLVQIKLISISSSSSSTNSSGSSSSSSNNSSSSSSNVRVRVAVVRVPVVLVLVVRERVVVKVVVIVVVVVVVTVLVEYE